MISIDQLNAIRDLIQEDVGHRGLRTDPVDNLITATAGDFAAACRSIAESKGACLWVVTGFFIPTGSPPCGETDGPLGALFMARALPALGVDVALVTDEFCVPALDAGLRAAGLRDCVKLRTLPSPGETTWPLLTDAPPPTCLVALERVGPSHTLASLQAQPGTTEAILQQFQQEVPPEHHDRCHTMRGRDITSTMNPAHHLFESARAGGIRTIGIGDGGNEIGMGKLPWSLIRRNIPNGGLTACRVPTDHLIVAGVSNWGAYALAAGIASLRGNRLDPSLFDVETERELLRVMVEAGPLVDGVTGQPSVSVDGLSFERYSEPLLRLGECEASSQERPRR